MHFDFAIIKKHPYGSAAAGIGLFVVFYLMMRGSSSSTAATSSNSPTAGDLQLAQIQAAQNSQAATINGQTQIASISAGVQNNQTAASLEAIKVQTAADLATAQLQVQASTAQQAAALTAQTAINSDNNKTQVDLLTVNDAANVAQQQILGGIITTQLTTAAETEQTRYNDQLLASMNDNATNLAAFNTQADYASKVAALSAGLKSQQIDQYGQQVQYIEQHAGEAKNTGKDADREAELFQTILSGGNPAVAISGNQTQAAINASNNSFIPNLLNSASNLIAKSGAMVIGGL